MRSLILFLFAALLFAGCSQVTDVNSPNQQAKSEFLKLNVTPQSAVEWTFGASKLIDGSKGGFVSFNKNYTSESGRRISLDVMVTIPVGAFSGKQVIGFTIDSETGVLDFSPSPMSFDIPLTLDYSIQGVDLSNSNMKSLDFYYLNGNKLSKVTYESKFVDQSSGTLQVNAAQIYHFSRYGWGTIVDPDPIDVSL